MNHSTAPLPHVEDGVNALLVQAKRGICNKVEEIEDCFQKSPGKAILICVAAGYLLNRLPIRSLVTSQIRTVAALAPPMVLAFGAAKLCEFLQGQAWKDAGHEGSRHPGKSPDLIE